MSANLPVINKIYIIKVTRGPDKGATFKLINRQVKIGRGPENDVALTDPKSSRNHALIHIKDNEILIEDLQSQSGVEVDGIKSPKSYLNHGSIISMGNTQLKFEELNPTESKAPIQIPKVATDILNVFDTSKLPQQKQTSSAPRTQSSNSKQSGKFIFYMIAALVIILLIILVTEDSEKKENLGLLSDSEIEQNIEDSQKRQQELIRNQSLKQTNTQQYQDAHATYLKGLRDYREGHFTRAMQSFSAALAIFPKHELAMSYYNLSRKRHDELVQFTFNEGQRYLEQNRYKEAVSSFQSVMVLINDPNNKTYKEAKELLNEATLLMRNNE